MHVPVDRSMHPCKGDLFIAPKYAHVKVKGQITTKYKQATHKIWTCISSELQDLMGLVSLVYCGIHDTTSMIH